MGAIEDRIKAAQIESDATRDSSYASDVMSGERPGRAKSVVQSVRLPSEDFAEIERIAREADVPVGALIRGWVLSGLASERDTTLHDAIDRLVADADRVRRLADRDVA